MSYKAEQKVAGAAFWNVVEEKHHGLTEIGDLWIDKDYRRKGLGEKLVRTMIEDMTRFFAKENYALRKVLVTTGTTTNQQRNSTKKSVSEGQRF